MGALENAMVRLAIILAVLAAICCGQGCRKKSSPGQSPASQPADGDRHEARDIPRIGLSQLKPLTEAPSPPARSQPGPSSGPASRPSAASRPATVDLNNPQTHVRAGDEAMARGDYLAAAACFE